MSSNATEKVGEISQVAPRYELRINCGGIGDERFEIWQIPCSVTPHVTSPTRIGRLGGYRLTMVEHRVRKRLVTYGIRPLSNRDRADIHLIPEELALPLGLLFKALAPVRNRSRIYAIAEGIDRMDYSETTYWLGMVMYRRNSRRILAALRLMLT